MKYIYKQSAWITIILLNLILFSCTKFDIIEEDYPDTNILTVQNIETNLAIINIEVEQEEFDYLMQHYSEDIEIVGKYYMFDSNLDTLFKDKLIDIGIKGSSTAAYPLKSLKLSFDHSLDNSNGQLIKIDKHLERHHYNKIKKIILRNSGNDFLESFIKDISYTQLAIDMRLDLELSHYRQVQVFINNKFYGLLNLRTEKSKTALAQLLDVDKNSLNILKINHLGGGIEEIEYKDGNEAILQELVTAVESGNTEKIKNLVDINSFADYIVFQDYIGNSDWPFNNVQVYNITDSLFRFFLYDLDFAGTRDKYFATSENDFGFIYKMYKALIIDDEVLAIIKASQIKIANYCTNEKFNSVVNTNANKIEFEIIYNISKYSVPKTNAEWYLEIEKMTTQFDFRRDNYLNEYF